MPAAQQQSEVHTREAAAGSFAPEPEPPGGSEEGSSGSRRSGSGDVTCDNGKVLTPEEVAAGMTFHIACENQWCLRVSLY